MNKRFCCDNLCSQGRYCPAMDESIPTEPGELDDEKRAVQSIGGLAIALAIVATICALIALPHLLKWLAS